jgi:predicted amidohydrolase
MARPLHIACLQTRPQPDFDSALAEALPLAGAAAEAGAQLIALPEYCGGLRAEGGALRPPSAPAESHPVLDALRDFAAARGVWMLVGSLAVDGPEDRIVNRGFLIDADGAVAGAYDKIHMFDIQLSETEVYRESATVAPGGAAAVYDSPFGRLGHTICYDLRFPRLFRDLAQAGAEILFCPAAFTKTTGEAHWHLLNRARAVENTRFVVSPCAVGDVPGGGACYGHSLIVDPWGDVLADGGAAPGVVSAVIDLDRVGEVAGRIPSLDHDRSYASAATPVARRRA